MNPETPNPELADDEPVTPVARRVGPPVAAGALLLTVALLAWLALAPTAIAGLLTDAPFAVPATLVVGPDDEGCLRVVAGDGAETRHCLQELAGEDGEFSYAEASFDAAGDVLVQHQTETEHVELRIDPVTGDVLDRQQFDRDAGLRDPGADGEEPVRVPDEPVPGEELEVQQQVYADGDLVRRLEDGGPRTDDGGGPVVLDLHGPPGYQLQDAVLSPDGAWVVATTPDDRVVVAPTNGAAPPYVWAEVTDDRWVSLWSAIHWDG